MVGWPRFHGAALAHFSTSADTSTWCCHPEPAGICPGSNSIWAWGRSFSSAAATRGSDPDPLAWRPDRQATAGQERSTALITSLTCPEPSGWAARTCFFGYPCWGSRCHPHRGTPIATFISSLDDSSGEPREDAMGTGNSQPPHHPRQGRSPAGCPSVCRSASGPTGHGCIATGRPGQACRTRSGGRRRARRGWLGFHATDGPLALLTAIAGALAGANLTLILLDMSRARSTRNQSAATTTTADAPSPDLAPVAPTGVRWS
jgi:hypothetical protein